MKGSERTPEQTYGVALSRAIDTFRRLNPGEVAHRSGAAYARHEESGVFELPFFGTLLKVEWPSGVVRHPGDPTEIDIASRLLLLHYLVTTDGAAIAAKWIAFRNLPGGLGYEPAFRRRANQRVVQRFGTDLGGFETAARLLGGEPLRFGDASFLFRTLPRVWLAVVLHLADDEFPADASVLFDGAASHHLPTEDLAVLGGMLVNRLIKSAGNSQNHTPHS